MGGGGGGGGGEEILPDTCDLELHADSSYGQLILPLTFCTEPTWGCLLLCVCVCVCVCV